MIIYDDDDKILIIPNGLGNLTKTESQGYEEGYAAGIEKGKAIQRVEDAAKLEERTFVQNGVYTPEYGYKKVRVDVDTTGVYNEGYNAGKEAQRVEDDSNLEEIVITENGEYTPSYGYSNVVVNVEGSECPELEEEVKRLEEENEELTGEIAVKNETISNLNGVIAGKDAEIAEKEDIITEKDATINEKDATINEKDATINEKDETIGQRDETINELNAVITGKEEEIAEKDTAINSLNNTITEKDAEIATLVVEKTEAYDNGIADQKGKLASTTIKTNGTYTREDGWNEVNVNIPMDAKILDITLNLEQMMANNINYKYSSSFVFGSGAELNISSSQDVVIIDYEGNCTRYIGQSVTHRCTSHYNMVYVFSNSTAGLSATHTAKYGCVYSNNITRYDYLPKADKLDMYFTPEDCKIVGALGLKTEIKFHTKDKPNINTIVYPNNNLSLYFPSGTDLEDLKAQYPDIQIIEY